MRCMAPHSLRFSLSCLWDWQSRPDREQCFSHAAFVHGDGLAGFEIPVRFEELEPWIAALRNGSLELPGSLARVPGHVAAAILAKSNSVHLECLKKLTPGAERWLCKQLRSIRRLLGISDFVIHPDEVGINRWRQLGGYLPSEVNLCVENMDVRKRDFQTPAEFEALFAAVPAACMTFDVCHWIELGFDQHDPELLAFVARHEARIRNMHFSVPHSTAAMYVPHPEILHKLAVGSGTEVSPALIRALPEGCAITIEGYLPPGCEATLAAEISLLSELIAWSADADRLVA